MLFRGTGKRSAALGSGVLVAGATLTVFGIAAPAQAAASNLEYTCSIGVPIPGNDDQPFAATMSVNVTGGVDGSVQVGDSVSLTGFETVANVTWANEPPGDFLVATAIGGHYNAFRVDAGFNGADPDQTVNASLDIPSGPTSSDGFQLVAPASPSPLDGFKANEAGAMNFYAGTSISGTLDVKTLISGVVGDESWSLNCTRSSNQSDADFFDATVTGAPTTTPPPTSPPPSHGSPPPSHGSPPPSHGSQQAGQQDLSQPSGLSNDSPSSEPSSSDSNSTTATGSVGDSRPTAHPQLANSGFSQALDLTIGAGALILAGAGLMYAARRRSVSDLDT